MKSVIIAFFIFQSAIFISAYLLDGYFSLLSYINISFFVSGLLLLMGGILFIIRTGSFDVFAKSMRKMLARKHQQQALESMRPPSEVFSKSPVWLFAVGLPIFAAMLIALAVYYA